MAKSVETTINKAVEPVQAPVQKTEQGQLVTAHLDVRRSGSETVKKAIVAGELVNKYRRERGDGDKSLSYSKFETYTKIAASTAQLYESIWQASKICPDIALVTTLTAARAFARVIIDHADLYVFSISNK